MANVYVDYVYPKGATERCRVCSGIATMTGKWATYVGGPTEPEEIEGKEGEEAVEAYIEKYIEGADDYDEHHSYMKAEVEGLTLPDGSKPTFQRICEVQYIFEGERAYYANDTIVVYA